MFDSVRTQEDLDYVKDQGFIVLKVTASEDQRLSWLATRRQKFEANNASDSIEIFHESVTPDINILNDGTVQALCAKVNDVLKT